MRLVTVVIVSTNQARFLSDAIQSVGEQRYSAHEIIVIDNGSSDTAPAIAERYPDIRFVRFRARQRLAVAWNTGVRLAEGDCLVLLNADERLLPSHFDTALRLFDAHPSVAMVCGRFSGWHPSGEGQEDRCLAGPDRDWYSALLRGNFIGPLAVAMLRRDVLTAIGGLCETSAGAPELALYLRIARNHTIVCHDTVVADCRARGHREARFDLLIGHLEALAAERRYARRRPDARAAYRNGRSLATRAYREAACREVLADVEAGHWRAALDRLTSLLTHAPTVALHALWTIMLGLIASNLRTEHQ